MQKENSTSSITLLFNDFLKNAKGVLDNFQQLKKLVSVNTNQDVEQVFSKIESALEPEVVLVRGPELIAKRVEKVMCNYLDYKPIEVESLTQ